MKIALITGGASGERDVSISSANNLKKFINFGKAEIFIFPEDKDIFIKNSKSFNIAIPIIHGKGGEDGEIQKLLKTLNIPYIFSEPNAHSIGIDKKLSKQLAESLNYSIPKEILPINQNFPLFVKPRFGGSSIFSGIY